MLAFVIKMISKYSSARYLHRMVNIDDVTEIAKMWISGNAYHEIHSIADFSEYKIIRRQREKTVSLEEIAGICDSDFGYSSSLIINSICEILKSQEDEGLNFDIAIENLQELAQKLKYGLPDQTDIFIYELGFNDRYLAQEKRKIIGLQFKKKDTKHAIKKFSKEITVFLSDYPSIYQSRLSAL